MDPHMCIRPILMSCFLIAAGSGAAAAQMSCGNEASVAEVRARLKACAEINGFCKGWGTLLETAVADFKSGRKTASECTQMLDFVSRNEQLFQESERRFREDRKRVQPPSGGGGGGGGFGPIL
jgi:hypothetical protein